ncbi:MAG TPA: hypothetical protein DCM71_03080 [Runella sp.]|nr:hypothetical protein [Runella sp.]
MHNLFGVELTIEFLGDFIKNGEEKIILVRDIAIEHCKEDLSGYIPTLNDWFEGYELDKSFNVPDIKDTELASFIHKPFFRSGLESSRIITCSNFGVYLADCLYGHEKAMLLANYLPRNQTIQNLLSGYKMTKEWQLFPDRNELIWLQQYERNNKI